MIDLLKQEGYQLDPSSNTWGKPGYVGIPYTDGEKIESNIARIVSQASDLSILSVELRQHCTDWPTIYHLSGERANILRPFEKLLVGDILEVGAGCGAITRYLGECGADVLALEGSPRRASIARSRTRDIEKVTVLAEKFDDFQTDHQFDVITLIGVLEYANLFTLAPCPALAMLKRVYSLLKPEGKLIVAIENQLGLKYFAGAPEDHVGQPMYGIEGRYIKNQPQTFGRKVLSEMLELSGYASSRFFAPFPDYKLAVSIITEQGFNQTNFDAAAFAWQSASRDLQPTCSKYFSLELAWPEIFRNGLGLELANSFLVVSSPSHNFSTDTDGADILAYHYSTTRSPIYCKETIFKCIDAAQLVVHSRTLVQNIGPTSTQAICFACTEESRYEFGSLLSWEFVQIVCRDGWSMSEVGSFLNHYVSLLEIIRNQDKNEKTALSPDDCLPGYFFDIIPQNIVVTKSGLPLVIDKEWSLVKAIELKHLLFRSMLHTAYATPLFGRNSAGWSSSRGEFIKRALESAGYPITEEEFSLFIEHEATIQKCIAGYSLLEAIDWLIDQPLQNINLTQTIANLSQAVAERDMALYTLYRSLSWRLTHPIRWISDKMQIYPLVRNLFGFK